MSVRLRSTKSVPVRRSLWSAAVVLSLLALTPDATSVAAQAGGQAPAAAETQTPLERGTAMRVPAFNKRSAVFKQETTALTLQPGEGMEYKYRLELGESFLYSWRATAPVHVELHTEPDGAPRGYSDSFELHDEMSESHGSYTAPYPGIHGWYWQNRTKDVVTVTLTSAGFYAESREFRKGQPVQRKPIP